MTECSLVVSLPEETQNMTALIVQRAGKYKSKIYMIRGNMTANAKSIMGMFALSVQNGQEYTIRAEGEDEQQAVQELKGYLTGSAAEQEEK